MAASADREGRALQPPRARAAGASREGIQVNSSGATTRSPMASPSHHAPHVCGKRAGSHDARQHQARNADRRADRGAPDRSQDDQADHVGDPVEGAPKVGDSLSAQAPSTASRALPAPMASATSGGAPGPEVRDQRAQEDAGPEARAEDEDRRQGQPARRPHQRRKDVDRVHAPARTAPAQRRAAVSRAPLGQVAASDRGIAFGCAVRVPSSPTAPPREDRDADGILAGGQPPGRRRGPVTADTRSPAAAAARPNPGVQTVEPPPYADKEEKREAVEHSVSPPLTSGQNPPGAWYRKYATAIVPEARNAAGGSSGPAARAAPPRTR